MGKVRVGLPVKLIIALIVICAAFTVLLVRYETGLFIDTLRTQRMLDMEQTLQYAGEYLDLRARHITQLAHTCSQIAALSGGDAAAIEEALRLFVDANIDTVRSAYFVTAAGRVHASRQVLYDVLVQTMDYDTPRRLAAGVGPSFATLTSEPYRSSMFTDRTVAFMRAVHDAAGAHIGAVVLEIDLGKLAEGLIHSSHLEIHPFLLVSRNGNVIYANQPDVAGDPGNTDRMAALAALPAGWSEYGALQSGAFQSYGYVCRNVRWKLVFLLDESVLLASVPVLISRIVLVSVASFALLAVLLALMAYRLTRPIRQLAREMRSVQGGESARLPQAVRLKRRDEIGDLYNSFALMIDRIAALLARQQETERARHDMELKVLQSQVSPHFLYNTLNTIGSLALQGRAREIPRTTSALIRLLAMSMDKTSELIPLSEELDALEAYIDIQRMRYGERFTLSLLVPDALRPLHVPKLVLQPLVENAIFHGFSDGRDDGLIVVEGRISGELLLLRVMDNGIGMPAEQAAAMGAGNGGGTGVVRKERYRSIGLRHIHARIQLRFGSAYGLSVTSGPGTGTMVTVSLPRHEPEA